MADSLVQDNAWLQFEGVDPLEAFGGRVNTGDYNGDGCTDAVVGAGNWDAAIYPLTGKVYVFFGPFDPGTVSSRDADVVFTGEVAGDGFGQWFTTGDFDGNGVSDLAISAHLDPTAGIDAGAVYVVLGGR